MGCNARGYRGRQSPAPSRDTAVQTPVVERPRREFRFTTPATKTCRRGPRLGWPQTLCNRVTVSYSLFRLFCETIATVRRPSGSALARKPEHQRLTGHPFRTSPFLPALRVSIQPCRGFQQADAAGRKGTMAKEICI